jgi:hypothetical protein
MYQLSDSDYYTLGKFIDRVLIRVRDGLCSASEGRRDIMHVVAAWDNGTWNECAPWMQSTMAQWERQGVLGSTW